MEIPLCDSHRISAQGVVGRGAYQAQIEGCYSARPTNQTAPPRVFGTSVIARSMRFGVVVSLDESADI